MHELANIVRDPHDHTTTFPLHTPKALHAASAPLEPAAYVLTRPSFELSLGLRAYLHGARQASALVPVLEVAAVGPVEHGVARRPAADHVPSPIAFSPTEELAVGVWVVAVEEDLRIFDWRSNRALRGQARGSEKSGTRGSGYGGSPGQRGFVCRSPPIRLRRLYLVKLLLP